MIIVTTFRWWEHPRRLWAGHAQRRTDRWMADARDALNLTGKYRRP